MNKAELIDAVAGSANLTRVDASRAVDALVDVIAGALKGDDEVMLAGFGTFTVRKRAARSGRNPRTGDIISIPASNLPAFKPGKALRNAVN